MLKHDFQSAVADGADATKVRPQSNWNDEHKWDGGALGQHPMRSAAVDGADWVDGDGCSLTNQTGGALAAGDVVAISLVNNSAVDLVDVVASVRRFVVAYAAISSAAAGPFMRSGPIAGVKAQGAIARGNYVTKSATSKAVEDTGIAASSAPPTGALGIALASAAGGVVTVLWFDMTANSAVPTGTLLFSASYITPTGYLYCDGSAVSRSTYATLFAALTKSATITVTIASPGVVTWTGHGLAANDPISFTTTGALPTGIVAGSTYYLKNVTADTFELSATPGGASINTSGSQSGVHTALYAPHGRGNGSTTFNVPDFRGRSAFGRDDMGGAAAGRLTTASGMQGATLGAAGGHQLLQQHFHVIDAVSFNSGLPSGQVALVPGAGTSNTFDTGGGDSQNIPPAGVVNVFIKI